MKQLPIKLSDLLMVMAAIGNNNFLLLDPVISPINDVLSNVESITLDTMLDLPVTMETLDWVYSSIKDLPENQYSGPNGRLLIALLTMAATDSEIADYLTQKQSERNIRSTESMKSGARFFKHLPGNLFETTP